MSASTRFLVTGGAGFIGSHLVTRLVQTGHEVRVLDDLSSGKRENLAAVMNRIDFMKGDVRDTSTVAEAVSGTDCVIHLAAIASVQSSVEDPVRTSSVNFVGSVNVLEQARRRGVRRVVFASSAAIYGQGGEPVKVESISPSPASPYAADKASVETMCRVFSGLYGLETVSLRFFNIYGPRQSAESDYATVIPRFVARMLGGQPPVVYGDGLQTRDFCYVDDVVAATILAATCPNVGQGEVINIGSGTSVSVLDLVREINAILGTQLEPEHAAPRPGDVRHSRADVSLAARLLGYTPQVSLAEGLRRTVEWFSERWRRT